MALHFKKITWKNFLSTGNAGTTLELDKNKTVLVQGNSGAGKSTIIDALCFVLYGKPFRDINKPLLVNSVNGKNLEVEIDFDTNGKQYRIIRGMKPNRFDIFCDGKLITQDAAVRDYQKVLENQILMMSYKTFTQIVILGSTSFTPFMQLSAAARREVVEDILDIGIFSTMNQLLKQQIQETKDNQQSVDVSIKTMKIKAEGLKRLIDTLSDKKEERIKELQQKIINIDAQISENENELSNINASITDYLARIKLLDHLVDTHSSITTELTKHEYNLTQTTDRKTFFEINNHCPVCVQDIHIEHKHSMLEQLRTEIQTIQCSIQSQMSRKTEISDMIKDLREISVELTEKKQEARSIEAVLRSLTQQKIELTESIVKLEIETSDVEIPKFELKNIVTDVIAKIESKKNLAQQRSLQECAAMLLKDDGIKASIIKEYLPLINKLLHLYLTELQMDVEYSLDDQFNEIVRSRYRDEFQYGNFSEGEKLRLDIAILLVWRHIAKIKNSANTNLLVVDEILSGRLDPTNQDIVIDMINRLADEGTNVFVIAHQDSLSDKFSSGIRFEKKGNFSVLV